MSKTRQTSVFQNILKNFSASMELAEEATNAQGNAEANQAKYAESYAAQMQLLQTRIQEIWIAIENSDSTHELLNFANDFLGVIKNIVEQFDILLPMLASIEAGRLAKNGLGLNNFVPKKLTSLLLLSRLMPVM